MRLELHQNRPVPARTTTTQAGCSHEHTPPGERPGFWPKMASLNCVGAGSSSLWAGGTSIRKKRAISAVTKISVGHPDTARRWMQCGDHDWCQLNAGHALGVPALRGAGWDRITAVFRGHCTLRIASSPASTPAGRLEAGRLPPFVPQRALANPMNISGIDQCDE